MPLDADALRVDGPVAFEVIDDATDAPGPGADTAPFVRGRLRLPGGQAQADDPLLKGPRAVGLNVVVPDRGIGPATLQHRGGRVPLVAAGLEDLAARSAAERDRQDDGDRRPGAGREEEGKPDARAV